MARVTVAATAPFGADVLERLAATHDIELLLTRPDKPRGRGRSVQPTAAKSAAERLGIPVAQPARLDESVELPTDTVVVAAGFNMYGDRYVRGLPVDQAHPAFR